MKKLILLMALLAGAFAQENISLTGEFSSKNSNPFKRVLNTPKEGTINYKSITSDMVLEVKTNLTVQPMYQHTRVEKQYVISASDLNKILTNYLSEDYKIDNSGSLYSVSFPTAVVNLTYFDNNENSTINHISKIEVTLNYVVNNVPGTITMDQTIGITGDNYDWSISTKKDYFVRSLEENIQRIIETQLFQILNKNKV